MTRLERTAALTAGSLGISRRDFNLLATFLVLVAVAYLGCVATGSTTSSIGVLSETGQVDAGVKLGTPRPVRSDEFLRASPERIGLIQQQSNVSAKTPLDFTGSTDFQNSTKSLSYQVTKWSAPDYVAFAALVGLLPTSQAFAAYWWLYPALLLLTLPLFLVLLRVPVPLAIAGTLLTTLSAPVAWWSEWPSVPLAIASAGSLAILVGVRCVTRSTGASRWWLVAGVALLIFGGSEAARLPFLYQPWSLPVTAMFAAITGVAVFASRERTRARITALVIAGGVAVLFAANSLYQQRALFETLASTVYPGARRSAGFDSAFPWSGPVVWKLQQLPNGALAVGNQSELAIGLLAMGVMAIVLVMTIPKSLRLNPTYRPAAVGAAVFLLLLTWTLAEWPSELLKYNPLVFIPGARMTQILGPLAAIVFVLALAVARSSPASSRLRRVYLASGIVIGILTIQSCNQFRLAALPSMSPRDVWISAFVGVAVIIIACTARNTAVALLPVLVFSVALVYAANPLMVGTGALTKSPIAVAVHDASASSDGRWASDGIFPDALILAAGAPQLSGQLGPGPNEAAWKILDPQSSMKNEWNRGSAYVTFAWTSSEIAVVSNPSPDIVQVAISPCAPAIRQLGLEWILTSQTVSAPCVSMTASGLWQGAELRVYKIS